MSKKAKDKARTVQITDPALRKKLSTAPPDLRNAIIDNLANADTRLRHKGVRPGIAPQPASVLPRSLRDRRPGSRWALSIPKPKKASDGSNSSTAG